MRIVNCELDGILQAYEFTKAGACDQDTKAESKWDTRSIEAGYLAGAQKKRLEELKSQIGILQNFTLKEFSPSDPITSGALVTVLNSTEQALYFLIHSGEGQSLNIDNVRVQVVTTYSPIGSALMNKVEGEIIELVTPKGKKEIEVIRVC